MPEFSPPPPTRFYRIQMLRFFAAFGVVLYHASFYLRSRDGGASFLASASDHHLAWGVQLFFVISGFVIAQCLERENVPQFLYRRMVRIYPAFWIAVAMVVAAKFWLFGGVVAPADLPRALSLLPFGTLTYPLGVEWTLVYEVAFYLLTALVAWVGWRKFRDALCVVWVIAIVGAALFVAPPVTRMLPTAEQVLLSALNLPFIAGMAVYRVHRAVPERLRFAALAVVPVALLAADRAAATELRMGLLGTAFGALVLWAVVADRRQPLNRNNPLVRLGDWSYGTYLVHVPVITILLALGIGKTWNADMLFLALVAAATAAGCAFGAFESRIYRRLASKGPHAGPSASAR